MASLKPLLILIPAGGLGLAWLFGSSKAQAAAPSAPQLPASAEPPSPEETAAAMSDASLHDAAAASHAADALAASQDHAAAESATQTALDKSAAAQRQVGESQAAAATAQQQYDAAAQLASSKASQGDSAAAAQAAALALQKKQQAEREAAAAKQAAAEALKQKQIAAATAAKALQAKQKKDAAIAKTAAAKQKADAARQVVKSSPQTADTLKLAAAALNAFLLQHRTENAAFGIKGKPSQPVADFQAVAIKTGHKIAKDGIVGPQTRGVAELAGVTLPPRPGAAPAPAHDAPPAPPGTPGVPAGFDAAAARILAAQVEKNLRNPPAGNVYNYDRSLMKRFQSAAGLKVDGEYGGRTRGALVYYGATSAPKALFAPTTTQPYKPPA